MNIILKKLLVTLLLGLQAALLWGGPVEQFVAASGIDSTRVALLITDLSDGAVVASYNADLPLIPASIMKTVSIATLLNKVGPDYRFRTSVFTDGKVRDGVLDGNLVIAGACDPSLHSRQQPGSSDIFTEIADALTAHHIDSIRGSIIIDESRFAGPSVPPSWAAGDLPHSYGTGTHPLNFEDNASGKSAVKDPQSVFLSRLRSALKARGIKVNGESMRGGHRSRLADHLSATVDEIMRSCMMRSDNMFAESILRTFSAESGGDGSTAEGAGREMKYWKRKGLPMEDVVIVDGSGLSRSNRVTADFMTGVLQKMADNVDYASFFPLAGQEGTLKNFLRDTPLDSYMALKTGSMNGIQCYAGYLLDDDYAPTHTVVVIINALPAGRAAARSATEQLLLRLFSPDSPDPCSEQSPTQDNL